MNVKPTTATWLKVPNLRQANKVWGRVKPVKSNSKIPKGQKEIVKSEDRQNHGQ